MSVASLSLPHRSVLPNGSGNKLERMLWFEVVTSNCWQMPLFKFSNEFTGSEYEAILLKFNLMFSQSRKFRMQFVR